MKKYTITLSPTDMENIQIKMKQYARDWKILRRLRCIVMRSEKKTTGFIMETLQVSADAITQWCKQYTSS